MFKLISTAFILSVVLFIQKIVPTSGYQNYQDWADRPFCSNMTYFTWTFDHSWCYYDYGYCYSGIYSSRYL